MHPLRVILDEAPAGGAWNMAVDEALLESAAETGETALRWYSWREPTVSLGYFQTAPEFTADNPLHGLNIVRRLSGGGAILHHHEWTYCCVLPLSHPLTQRPTALYTEVHEAVIDVINSLGGAAKLRGERMQGDEKQVFLCFLRGDPRDVVFAGHKIVGSAQRRRGGAVLQHGSVLLRASRHSPGQPGLRDLTDINIDDDVFRNRLAQAVGERLATIGRISIVDSALTAAEERKARRLEAERYSRLDWKAK
jgi:lipoate-protein ligase A